MFTMNKNDREKLGSKARLSLVVYDRPEDVRLPNCEDLRVYGLCEDEWPVVYVFEEVKKAA